MDPVITVDRRWLANQILAGSRPPRLFLSGSSRAHSAVAGSVPSSLDEESAASIGAANRSTQSSLAQVSATSL